MEGLGGLLVIERLVQDLVLGLVQVVTTIERAGRAYTRRR